MLQKNTTPKELWWLDAQAIQADIYWYISYTEKVT